MDLSDCKEASSPGTKAKPITKTEQPRMLEKRLKNTEGGNCIIANLKSQLGRAKKELEEKGG